MTKLPGAKPSPRIAGGVLRWYAGDTFSVTLALELRDQDGETVSRFSPCSMPKYRGST